MAGRVEYLQIRLTSGYDRITYIVTESAERLEQLTDEHGCEASSEREFHRGRIEAARSIGEAIQ